MYIMLPIMLAVRIGNDEDRKYLEKLYNETYRALVSYADSILQCREDSLDQVQALFLEMTGSHKDPPGAAFAVLLFEEMPHPSDFQPDQRTRGQALPGHGRI